MQFFNAPSSNICSSINAELVLPLLLRFRALHRSGPSSSIASSRLLCRAPPLSLCSSIVEFLSHRFFNCRAPVRFSLFASSQKVQDASKSLSLLFDLFPAGHQCPLCEGVSVCVAYFRKPFPLVLIVPMYFLSSRDSLSQIQMKRPWNYLLVFCVSVSSI